MHGTALGFLGSSVRGPAEIHFSVLAEFLLLQRFYMRGFYLEKDSYPVLARIDKVAEFLSVANTVAKFYP